MNNYWLFAVIPLSMFAGIIIGAILMSWFMTRQLKKAMGIKSWREFINQAKQAQKMQKKMEKEGIFGVMNDPALRKQMEELQKRFRGKP